MKFANYDKINKDGVINENTYIEDRDVIISKIIPIKGIRSTTVFLNQEPELIEQDAFRHSLFMP